jgi:heptosyltransferase-2/heptosyltransferase-3
MYEAIKKAYPRARLSVLAGSTAASVLENNPYIDEIIKVKSFRSGKLGFFLNYLHSISRLRKMRFDLAVDAKGSILNIIMMYLIGAKTRVSYWNVSGGKPLLTNPVFYSRQVHEIDAGLNMLKLIGIKTKYRIPQIYLSKDEIKKSNKITAGLPKKYVCVYMTPTKISKSWPAERWHALFSHFNKTQFFIRAREHEKPVLAEFTSEHANVNILSLPNIRILPLVFKNARAIVAVDGGIMHLAWISNPRTISLFGQNDLILWRPLRGRVISHYPLEKQGINRTVPNFNKPNKYMAMVAAEEVAAALEKYVK